MEALSTVLKKRIPKVPYWRWIAHNIMRGTPVQIPFDKEIFSTFISEARVKGDEAAFEITDEIENIDSILFIFNTQQVKNPAESMLYERVAPARIAKTLNYKFQSKITEADIIGYIDYFYDTTNLTNIEIANFFKKAQSSPTSGKFRADHITYENGGDVEMDMDDAMAHMFTRCFFESEKLF